MVPCQVPGGCRRVRRRRQMRALICGNAPCRRRGSPPPGRPRRRDLRHRPRPSGRTWPSAHALHPRPALPLPVRLLFPACSCLSLPSGPCSCALSMSHCELQRKGKAVTYLWSGMCRHASCTCLCSARRKPRHRQERRRQAGSFSASEAFCTTRQPPAQR